ncbi:MAG: lipopolysaccharide assembly LapA domain-containing protein [Hyphomicrobiales bacterium]
MKRVFFWIIGLPAVVLIVVLSIANRQPVEFSLDPVSGVDPAFTVAIPLFLLLFGAGFLGLLVGWLVGWNGQRRWRREARKQKREVARLQSQARRAERRPAPATGRALVAQPGDPVTTQLAS